LTPLGRMAISSRPAREMSALKRDESIFAIRAAFISHRPGGRHVEDGLQGYRGPARRILEGAGMRVGDEVELTLSDGGSIAGVLMPRYEHADCEHITVKLRNGYNAGVAVSRIVGIRMIGRPSPEPEEVSQPSRPPSIPRGDVIIIGTGGTIASRIDYRTGAVTPVFRPEDLYSRVPGLGDIAKVQTDVLFNILSENMTPDHWTAIAERIGRAVSDGYRGIIITHGTDTMHYTAAALSFSLEGLPVPVILVGAQRSSDRPSSDASSNLRAAVLAASRGEFSGVYIAMHRNLSDHEIAIHPGVKVRKNHTSRRDAFQPVNSRLAAVVDLRSMGIEMLADLPPRGDPGSLRVRAGFDRRAFLLKYFPGMDGGVIDNLVDRGYRAIILEGTGLGHVGKYVHESIHGAIERGVFVGMTSQCIWGSVRMTVYDTGRDLLKMGVVPLEDMLPEVALVKAMWLLGQGVGPDEMRTLMPSNLRGEISRRRLVEYE